ncbi:AAA family ATPase [Dactylosporangium sp. NPDC050688]|uniref:ATP-binding protein n=1 Tax=Dactylosporangium sp. NPDC050688 TaxID=3157217 RepID=UPI0033C1B1DB
MKSADDPNVWVGRSDELALIRAALDNLNRGKGAIIWVEGEPGIGKSSLVARALERADPIGCQVLQATADQLTQQFPLAVMLDCLEVTPRSADPRRVRTAQLLHERRMRIFAADEAGDIGDIGYAQIELLVSLVDEICAGSPTAIVLDDAQWADDASLLVWHRLTRAVDQLPLLLVATCRTAPRRSGVRELRSAVVRRGGTVITLDKLPDADATALVTQVLGAEPGPRLSALTAQALGNPLYLRELIDAVIRERGTDRPAGADVSKEEIERIPASFSAIVDDRLRTISPGSADALRNAALLGSTFRVTDLAVVLGRTPSELTEQLMDASAAGIVVGAGTQLAFRHPLVRQALYDGVPAALRIAMHQQAAMALAAAGAEPLRVAEQLLASGERGNAALRSWLAQAHATLIARAPAIAAELLRREIDHSLPSDGVGGVLALGLTRALLSIGRHEEAAAQAGLAIASAHEPEHRAEAHWLLVRANSCLGRSDAAMQAIQRALSWPQLPDAWRGRLLALQATYQRATDGDLDTADSTAQQALRIAETAADAYATAQALIGLWLNHSVRRDHKGALQCVDQALAKLGDGPDNADLRAFAVDSRIFSLQNLDRWADAEATLKHARELEQRSGYAASSTQITAAVLRYWLGQWDDALAELGPDPSELGELTYTGLREPGPVLLWYGIAALVAGRRNQRQVASEYLRAGLSLPVTTVSDRENRDFLLAAQALAAEQNGDVSQARAVLSDGLRRRPGEMTLVHQWLPDLVRLCLLAGDRPAALAAAKLCGAEADAESEPARATAALARCVGLLDRDPAALREAVEHYRTVGATLDLAGALEDLAVVVADRGSDAEARLLLNESSAVYHTLGADWDVRRADGRLRRYGIRRGVHGPRTRQRATGWAALTPTEQRIAVMVAEGASTSSIAQTLFLSRRTVQTHISNILAKLGLHGRVEIAREVYRHTA